MIRVVMFDLGGTLVDNDRRPFPHVTDALTAIAAFKTADGKLLRSCLVSDYTMPEPVSRLALAVAVAIYWEQDIYAREETFLSATWRRLRRKITSRRSALRQEFRG
jgi:hypothetical protein